MGIYLPVVNALSLYVLSLRGTTFLAQISHLSQLKKFKFNLINR